MMNQKDLAGPPRAISGFAKDFFSGPQPLLQQKDIVLQKNLVYHTNNTPFRRQLEEDTKALEL